MHGNLLNHKFSKLTVSFVRWHPTTLDVQLFEGPPGYHCEMHYRIGSTLSIKLKLSGRVERGFELTKTHCVHANKIDNTTAALNASTEPKVIKVKLPGNF